MCVGSISSNTRSTRIKPSAMLYISLSVLLINLLVAHNERALVEAKKDKGGDDIILAKGRIILRGSKGKETMMLYGLLTSWLVLKCLHKHSPPLPSPGNIIVDPGHSGGHEMVHMMPMMGHFNPYAFYPMQHHHQPQVMIRPIYIEDHSAMHHMPEPQHHEEHHHVEHHEEQHHHEPEQHHHQEHYHHEEPQHEQNYVPQPHEIDHQPQYESHEHHEEHHEQPHEGYEHQHHEHPLMSLLSMHGSGPQPIYQQHNQQQQQQMATMQALQQPVMYAQLLPQQQVAAYQQAQYLAAEQEAAIKNQQQSYSQPPQQEVQGQSSEVASGSPSGEDSASASSSTAASAPSKPASKMTALLEKSANNPLARIIKPLFKRNKDHKDSSSSQKKP